MLTREYILLYWEQDLNETLYFTYTPDGDCIICDIETEQFYYENFRNEISYREVCKLLELIA
ncbi:hypothetical protein D3C84_349820 [compost metagenome]